MEGIAAKKPHSKIGKLPVDTLLHIQGSNANTESGWHHAGKANHRLTHVCSIEVKEMHVYRTD